MAEIMFYLKDNEDGSVTIKTHPPMADIRDKTVRLDKYLSPAETYAVAMARTADEMSKKADDDERASKSGLVLPKGFKN